MENTNIICGKNAVLESLMSGQELEKIFMLSNLHNMGKILDLARRTNTPIANVPREKLDSIAKNHQGIVAFISGVSYCSIDDLFEVAKEKEQAPFFVILDSIEDPHNLGAIIRSANGAGAHGVIIPKNRAAQVTDVARKASAGATAWTKIARVTNIRQTIDELKSRGVWIYGAAGEAAKYYTNTDFSGGAALVIGNEGKGISGSMQSVCDFLVSIPMRGEIESLNASVAAGILLYEIAKT
jgi:23S rRNA (guanosine2251-2'-O)-methyltransferase